METITGSNGIIIPPKGYLPGVRKICDEFGIVMICDEVMAGWGRTGKMFAFENFDVKPDLVTFAKGVTCGYVQLGGVASAARSHLTLMIIFFPVDLLTVDTRWHVQPVLHA